MMLLLVVYYINVETDSALLLSKEARMMPLEPSPLPIHHDVIVLSFVSLACQDGRLKKAN